MAPGIGVFGEAVETQGEPIAPAALVHLEAQAIRVDESRRDDVVVHAELAPAAAMLWTRP